MRPDSAPGGRDSRQEFEQVASKVVAKTHPEVLATINANDETLGFVVTHLGRPLPAAWTEYFALGHLALSMLTDVLQWVGRGWSDVGSFLDFAAGYGRCTRFVRTVLKPEAIWVSDIVAPAIEFQKDHFQVHGFVSDVDPGVVDMQRNFDLISVISLFTHLPEPTFHAWLSKLAGSLAPGGIMVFTSHGMELVDEETAEGSSFHFQNRSESKVLDTESYGNTFCTRDFIEQAVQQVPDVSLLAHLPKGLNRHQDVNVIGRGVASPAEPCVLRPSLQLMIDMARLDAGSAVSMHGWALDEGLRPVERMDVLLDGIPVGEATLLQERPDLAKHFGNPNSLRGGWSFESTVLESPPRWVAIIAEAASGARQFAIRAL